MHQFWWLRRWKPHQVGYRTCRPVQNKSRDWSCKGKLESYHRCLAWSSHSSCPGILLQYSPLPLESRHHSPMAYGPVGNLWNLHNNWYQPCIYWLGTTVSDPRLHGRVLRRGGSLQSCGREPQAPLNLEGHEIMGVVQKWNPQTLRCWECLDFLIQNPSTILLDVTWPWTLKEMVQEWYRCWVVCGICGAGCVTYSVSLFWWLPCSGFVQRPQVLTGVWEDVQSWGIQRWRDCPDGMSEMMPSRA